MARLCQTLICPSPGAPAAGPTENCLLYQEHHGYDMEKMAPTLLHIPDLNEDQADSMPVAVPFVLELISQHPFKLVVPVHA